MATGSDISLLVAKVPNFLTMKYNLAGYGFNTVALTRLLTP